jgi:hypothetical protein
LEDYFEKLYKSDPLFRSLVDERLREDGRNAQGDGLAARTSLTEEEEISILREYAISLYKEHKALKNLFIDTLKVTPKSVGVRAREQRKPPGEKKSPNGGSGQR